MIATAAIPPDWTRHLRGGPLCLGYDVATTEKKTSNPSSITVTEDYGGTFWQRLIVRFKTAEPEAAMQALDSILRAVIDTHGHRYLRELNIDSSNEKYHARTVKGRFRRYLRVNLIAGGEALVWQGEKFIYKTLLGQLYVSAFEDHRTALPAGEWIVADHRLVKNHAGSFAAEIDESGNHADTFDSGKLALWGFLRKNRHETTGIQPLQVGGNRKRALDIARRRGSFRKEPGTRLTA